MACRCNASMIREGNYMVCSQGCGYKRELIQRVPTQAELLEEKRRLELEIQIYRKFLEDFIEQQDKSDFVIRAEKLLQPAQD